jgi:hypothetical protein
MLGSPHRDRKDRIMDDFPIWLKAVIYLMIEATMCYTVGEFV